MDISRFKMLDELVATGERFNWARYRSTVPADGPLFEAHFPGYPVLPGVLQIEMMAQASGFLIMLRRELAQMAVLAGVEKARFRRPIPPNTILVIQSTLEQEMDSLVSFACEVSDADGLVSSASVRLALHKFPNPTAQEAASTSLKSFQFPRKR